MDADVSLVRAEQYTTSLRHLREATGQGEILYI